MTNDTLYRLHPATVAEALVNKWVAWSNTVPPVAGSLHLKNFQLKLLESYLKDPKVHLDACKNPKYRAGPFVDIPIERMQEVADLLAFTQTAQRKSLELATEIKDFQSYLVQEAKGQSLDPYYQKVPPGLQGFVELAYDYFNRPMVRFFESLLYEAGYYDRTLQSLRFSKQPNHASRSFIMSTPRLPSPEAIEWTVAFDDPRVDELFRLDAAPKPLGAIRELLGLEAGADARLLPLLSEQTAAAPDRWDGESVRVRYFGHACALVEWSGNAVLMDPYIGVEVGEGDVGHYSYEHLPPKLDYVVITHSHHDHFSIESLLRIRHKTDTLVVPRTCGVLAGDPSLKLLARKIGFKKVIELDALESLPLENGEIVSIPFLGEHADLLYSKSAYVVRAGRERILFAADSDCLDQKLFDNIRAILGPIETVFLGMECVGAPLSWTSGAFFPARPDPRLDKTRRYKGADSARGLRILEALRTKRIYNYAMGLEPWLEHLLGLAYTEDSTQLSESRKFIASAKERGMEAQLLFGKHELFLEPGR